MKNFIKLISSAALLVMFSLALSSYNVQPIDDPGNGVLVEVIKGGDYWLSTSCGLIYRDKNTQQYKDGVLHMRTTTYTIPEGCPDIPDKARKDNPWEGYTLNYTPSGKVVVKEIYNN